MISATEYQELLKAALTADKYGLQNAVSKVVSKLDNSRDRSANQAGKSIRHTWQTTPMAGGYAVSAGAANKDDDTSQVKPRCCLDDLSLNREQADFVEAMLGERAGFLELMRHNLRPTRLVLLHGPSGTGKTSIVHALADALKLPLWEMDAANIVTSALGGSAANIVTFLDKATKEAGVVLVDEADSLLGKRTTNTDACAREDNAITNTMLRHLEKIPNHTLLFCATNMTEIVDPAMFRRFDVILHLGYPPEAELHKLAARLAEKHKIPKSLIPDDLGFSFATAERAVLQAAREFVLDKVRLRNKEKK